MDVGQDDLDSAAIARAIGDELRRARDNVGWSRAELVSRLPSKIHSQTLAAYERGVRQCTIERFVEICLTIGVSAPRVLSGALQRAEIDLTTIQIDLHAVLNDNNSELLPLRRWARKRLKEEPDGIVRLDWAVVQEMANLSGSLDPISSGSSSSSRPSRLQGEGNFAPGCDVVVVHVGAIRTRTEC